MFKCISVIVKNKHVDTVSSLKTVSCFLSAYWITFPSATVLICSQLEWVTVFLTYPELFFKCKSISNRLHQLYLLSPILFISLFNVVDLPLLAICSVLGGHLFKPNRIDYLPITFFFPVPGLLWPTRFSFIQVKTIFMQVPEYDTDKRLKCCILSADVGTWSLNCLTTLLLLVNIRKVLVWDLLWPDNTFSLPVHQMQHLGQWP